MEQTFINIWGYIYDFAAALVNGLNSVLITGGLEDLKDIVLNVKLFSDNAIISLDIYTILIWVLLSVGFVLIYKFFKAFILIPIRFIKGGF